MTPAGLGHRGKKTTLPNMDDLVVSCPFQLTTVFELYQNDGRAYLKFPVQWRVVMDLKEFCLQK